MDQSEEILVEMCRKGSSGQTSQNKGETAIRVWCGMWFVTCTDTKRLQALEVICGIQGKRRVQ